MKNALSSVFNALFAFIAMVFTTLFGHWHPPVWLRFIGRMVVKFKWLCLGLFVLSLAGTGGWWWYDSQPKPHTIVGTLQSDDIHGQNTLVIHFDYAPYAITHTYEKPSGSPKAANIALLNKPITDISLKAKGSLKGDASAPVGEWRWIDDTRLHFVPKKPWLPGVEYDIQLPETLFSKHVVVHDYHLSFSTGSFTGQAKETEFYQSPTETHEKRVRATLQFSHPVNADEVKKHTKMWLQTPNSRNINDGKAFEFELRTDPDHNNIVYLFSQNITLPEHETYMRFKVDTGLLSTLGGGGLKQAIEGQALVPTGSSFFSLKNTTFRIVRDEDNQPHQILTLALSDATKPEDLHQHLELFLLPAKSRIGQASEFTPSVQAQSNPIIHYQILPIERDTSQHFGIKLDVPEGRKVYVRINPGLVSANGFVFNKVADAMYRAPSYPRELRIGGEGAILSRSGSLALPISARGVDKIQFDIGTLLPNQINHMVSQQRGDLSHLNFDNWSFNEHNIADFNTTVLPLKKSNLKDEVYATLNLRDYLPTQKDQMGVYFITAHGLDQRGYKRVTEKRVIVVTDLGIIVKADQHDVRHVFVQSIDSGQPVMGATVKLLGLNGQAIVSGTTNRKGYVKLQGPTQYERSRTPTVFVVNHNNDTSYIPYAHYQRQINTSRFDVGGVYDQHDPKTLNAYLFTDRGIYRPGETVNLGAVIKHADLSTPSKQPIQLQVFDTKQNMVFKQEVQIDTYGFNEFSVDTEATWLTGKYRAVLNRKTEHNRFRQLSSIEFSVEEFLPDTLKIQSTLANTVHSGWNTDTSVTVDVDLQNLFGAAAQNRRVTARYSLSYATFSFNEYADYDFSVPYKRLHKSLTTSPIQEQKTDKNGLSQFNFALTDLDQGMYQLNVHVEGFDQAGGRAVIAKNTARIATVDSLVGVKADGALSYIHQDSKRTLSFVAIDNRLQPIAWQNLTLSVVHKQPISTLIKQRDGRYNYETVIKRVEVSSQDWHITQAGNEWVIDSSSAGDYDIEIHNADGKLLKRIGYSIAGSGNHMAKLDRNAELHVKLDKDRYQAGDTIEMHITAPYTGSGLITIETGTVEHSKWFTTTSESSIQTLLIPAHLEGNAYINVSFVRAADSQEIFTSPLSYAVVPFKIDNPARQVDIELVTQAVYRPGEPMPINYSTNKPARLALFAVDTGILQVAKYPAPNPLDHFMKKKALGVTTSQILDLILPDITAMARFSAPGGGDVMMKALANNLNPFAREADKPAVYWGGIVDANRITQETHITLPDTFAGELSIFAVAIGDGAMGVETRKAKVKGAFVISPATLTQAAPGDEFDIVIGISNLLEGSGNAATIDANISTSEHLQLVGASKQRFSIDEGSETTWRLRAKATENLGAAHIDIRVSHHNAADGTVTQAKRRWGISVRPSTPYFTTLSSGHAKGGTVTIATSRQMYAALAERDISASASPLVLVEGLLSYLDTYPHGCTEQQVSKVFPVVGMMSHPKYREFLPDLEDHFATVVGSLRSRQRDDGGFVFWPAQRQSSAFASLYALHFLIESSQLGYPAPQDMIERGKGYLRAMAREGYDNTLVAHRDRAYAIYLLTELGEVTTNYLTDIEIAAEKSHPDIWKQDLTAAYIAASYQRLQNSDIADELLKAYNRKSLKQALFGRYYNAMALDAQYVYLVSKHFKDQAQSLAGNNVMALTNELAEGRYNTIGAAYSVLALGRYSQAVLADPSNEHIQFTAKHSADAATDAMDKILAATLTPFPTVALDVNTHSVEISTQKPLYYLATDSGFDKPETLQNIQQGLEIHREYRNKAGDVVTRAKQGDILTVAIKARSLGRVQHDVAIVDLLPAGFEVERDSLSRNSSWRRDYYDVREDRVIFYGSMYDSLQEISYDVRVTAAGEFTVPAIMAESMYQLDVRAVAKPSRITVTANEG